MRYACVTEYDGTNFSGFQRQLNAKSIQECIEVALQQVTQKKIPINYSGRTDAGVHALSQVFDFETSINRDSKNWLDGLNSNLPKSINIKNISQVSDDFHSRFSAKERSYSYVIYNSKNKPLFFNRFCFWESKEIDLSLLKKEAKHFLGNHDFSSFRSSSCNSKNPNKKITKIDINVSGKFIIISITANAFLHNMVRIIVGTLLDIAKGEIKDSVIDILSAKNRNESGRTLSPQGLFFLGPKYESKLKISSPFKDLFERFKV